VGARLLGPRAPRREAARFDLGAREEDVRATTLTLVGDVATAYLQVREFDESVRIADETLASRRATLDLARRRFRQGVTSELDVAQFEAELADPATRVADFTRQRAQAENRLALLLGRSPGPVARGRSLEATVASVRVPDSLPGALVARRPDVLAAERGLAASVARVGAASASRLPAVTLGGQYGTQRPDFARLFGRAGEVYARRSACRCRSSPAGRLRSEVRAAEARADQTRARYDRTVLTRSARRTTRSPGAATGRDQLGGPGHAGACARAGVLPRRARYRSGVSSYFEVLDAQRRLFAAQLALVQVQRQYLVSTVDLYRALGGGWESAPR
jgi:multidrug efflux system outer membrane protein